MADISNFRRVLLSPVPEQEPVVTTEPRPTTDTSNYFDSVESAQPNELTCSTSPNDNKCQGQICVDSCKDACGDATSPVSVINELSLSCESTDQGSSGRSKSKDKDKKKDQQSNNSSSALNNSSESSTKAANKFQLGFTFFNKRKNNSDDSLIRLFSSEVFDSSLAISYLFSSKEQGVLDYIG